MIMLGLSSSVYFAYVTCYCKFFFCTTHKPSVSTGFTEQIMPNIHILCYNVNLVIWTVVSLTIAKFKPLIFSVSGFTFSYTSNMFILMILCDFRLSPAKFYYIIVHIRKLKAICKSRTVWLVVKVKVTLRLTVSQPVSLGVKPYLGLMTRYLLLFDSYGLAFMVHLLWREDGSVLSRFQLSCL
jgi:hypothetical protein